LYRTYENKLKTGNEVKYLSNVHSSRRFKTIVTNRLRLFSEEVKKFIFLNALFSDASHDLKSLFRTQQPMHVNSSNNEN
jgi:hypothetical protein